MTPDLNHSIAVHNRTMPKWWGKYEYIQARIAFIKRNPVCARCGRKATTPGHSHDQYKDYETYRDAVVNDECVPLCPACNVSERKGMKPCPECVKKYHANETIEIHYIGQHSECCKWCLPDGEKDIINKCQDAQKQFIRAMHDKDNTFRRMVYRQRHPLKAAT